MSVQIDDRVEELARLPWSREVVADEDGVFVAAVPEIDGCFADGDTLQEALAKLDEVLREWLAIAVASDVPIPDPRRLQSSDYSGRFSVRLPRSLHRRLALRAEQDGSSLNQLVTVLLTHALAVDGRRGQPHTQEVPEHMAAAAVRTGPQSIGAIKGIAKQLRDRGQINLACVLYGLASVRIMAAEGPETASRELGVAGALARKGRRLQLAEALLRESVLSDPTNLRSSSALGQLLHHQERYEEAIDYLQEAAPVDNHARQFLGWSLLLSGLQHQDQGRIHQGLENVVEALRNWAYQNSEVRERPAWEKQVRRLRALGAQFAGEAEQLIDFANAHAGWGPTDPDILSEPWTEDLADTTEERMSRIRRPEGASGHDNR